MTMTLFPVIALLGLSVIAVWVWFRWRRHGKKSAAVSSPPTVSPDTDRGKAVEPFVDQPEQSTAPEIVVPAEVDVTEEAAPVVFQAGDVPDPVALPEATSCDFPPAILTESQPVLLDAGETVLEQPAETHSTDPPSDAAKVVETFVSQAEQPMAPEFEVPPELCTAEETQTAIFQVEDVPGPVALPEVTSHLDAPIPSESPPVLPDMDSPVFEQPADIFPTNLPPDGAHPVEATVDQPEQPYGRETASPVGLDVAGEAETAPFPAEVLPHSIVPSILPPEADNSPHEPSLQTDTKTSSPPESAITPTALEEEPNGETLQQVLTEPDTRARAPTYRPIAPAAVTASPRTQRAVNPRSAPNPNTDLRLRVQLVFARGGAVKNLALVPDRRDGMPSEITIVGTQGELHLTELRNDCYEPVILAGINDALLQGFEWHGRGDARRWRWVLGGRELYILVPGDEFGLYGFVSTTRLWLNARQVVLATTRLRDEVLSALAMAGCTTPEVSDDTTPGVPSGWLVFRDVIPTRAVPMRDDQDILNSLCPAHDIEPHFAGGIRLERNSWLAGFPPRIRFTGEFTNGFQVKIDGHPAHRTEDGGFEVPGWDSEGEHRLWFGGRAENYSLCTMDEAWEPWPAHDFGHGAAICGAGTYQLTATQGRQVRVPVSNLLLIGARPGEIFHCHLRSDVRCETVLATASFVPVWALPLDPAHADKESTRILLLHPSEPLVDSQTPAGKRAATHDLREWISVIREAGCKGLALAPADQQTEALWRRFRAVAKQLRRGRR
jgi:hypothetical protein